MSRRRLAFEETATPAGSMRRHARIGQGDRCVLLLIETVDFVTARSGIVLDPATARALGRALILSATYSERPLSSDSHGSARGGAE